VVTDANGCPDTVRNRSLVSSFACAISLTKTPNKTNVCNGANTSVTYTYVVTNTGGFPASGTLTDDHFGSIGSWGPLAPGASQTLTASSTINATTTNIATASGTTGPQGSDAVSATATATVTGHTCSIALTKTPSTLNVCNDANTSVTYTYVVTNTGDFFSASGSLSDDHFGSIGSWGPLAAGASATLTKASVINATTTNIATASGTSGEQAVSATATATVTGHSCSISLTKTPDKTNVCNDANTSVTYTYVVTNTGDFFSASGTLTDDHFGSIGSWGPLASGASATLTKAAAINATTTNIATASGTSGAKAVSATATATVTGHTCSISLTKTPDKTNVCIDANTSVTYTYVVTNTGDFFSASGSLTDDHFGSIGSWGPLAAGASATLTKAAVINATTTNIATASGTSGEKAVSATASATVVGNVCAISLTKTPSTLNVCNDANTSVTYTYVVCNTSTTESVTGTLSDDHFGSIGSWGPLAPGACQTLTKASTINATTTNIATASGTFTGGGSATATATATVTGHTCSISLTKTPNKTDVCNDANSSVTYTYVVCNTGDFFAASGTLSDDHFGSIGSWGPLAAGACQTLTKSATINATTVNIATASGTSGAKSVSATATATVTGHTCSISLTKTPDKTDVCNNSNTSVTYTYVVCNTGNFFSASGSLTDDHFGSIGSWGPLAAGACQTLTASATINGTTTNIATASGTSDEKAVSATASATVTGHVCAISLTKTPNKTDVCNDANTSVTYTYVVCNNSTVESASGTLADDHFGSIGSWGPLAPGACQTLTASATINATTVNIATASGTFTGGTPTTATATATVTGHTCSISLTKTPDKNEVCDGLNTLVTYTYVVCNTGNFFSASGTLVDDNGTPGTTADDVTVGSWGPLASGACQTLTKGFTLTGARTNIATASGTSGGKSVSATATATVTSKNCGGNIFPTQTTCSDFTSGSATNQDSACYQFSGSGTKTVTNAQPGVVFYYVKVTLTSFPSTVNIIETRDVSTFRLMTLNSGNAKAFTGNCASRVNVSFTATLTSGSYKVAMTFPSGTPAGDYIISLQMSVKSILGSTFTGSDPRVSYCFTTNINGSGVFGADCLIMKDQCSGGAALGQAGIGELTMESVPAAIPTVFALHANYPNPFNPSTMIQYDLPEASTVKLSVFNILGQLVATLVNGHVEAGYQAVEWNTDNSGGKSLSSGMYIYRIDATSSTTGKSFSQVRKMVLMK
jgi:hypothetical protein